MLPDILFIDGGKGQVSQAMGVLEALQVQGVRVVGVAIDDDLPLVEAAVRDRGIRYSVLSGNQELFLAYDGFSIPYTLLLDSNLTVQLKVHGRLTDADREAVLGSTGGDL